ncbi:MAG: CAP domain-containing protein [Gemmatimonadetes bacterium]|nr:CAP domain-containing protein [Gemmatimonadota bacterium]
MKPIAFPATVLALPLAACMAAVPPGESGPLPASPGAPAAQGDVGAEVLRLVNADRGRHGCPALQWDAAAAGAAQAHSDDMARRNYFSHTSPEGRTAVDRLHAQGANFRALAENIAMGQPTPAEAVRSWLGSAGHRENIENCVYTRSGVGYRDGRWTQVFYTPL